MKADVVVRGGTLIIPGVGPVKADLATAAGKIVAIGDPETMPEANRIIDARGLHVLPGLFDPHIHVGLYQKYDDDVRTETQAALGGGFTTVGIFFAHPKPYREVLKDHMDRAAEQAVVDVKFHAILRHQTHVDEIEYLWEAHGIDSFKMYMAGVPGVMVAVDDGLLVEGFTKIAQLPGHRIACVHAENDAMINQVTARMQEKYKDLNLVQWSDTHPNISEEEAVYRVALLARRYNCPLYIVHLSTKEGARALKEVGGSGLTVETITPYLSCTKRDGYGVLGKMLPPFREQEDVDELWDAVKDGRIDTIGTDHIAITKEKKLDAPDMYSTLPAAPAMETSLPFNVTEGHLKRGIDLTRIVEMMSANPAKAFGLYPHKGTLAVGSDGDVTIIDLNTERTVRAEEMYGSSNFSFLEGKRLKGWPVYVLKDGRVALDEGKIVVEPGSGRLLRRTGFTPR